MPRLLFLTGHIGQPRSSPEAHEGPSCHRSSWWSPIVVAVRNPTLPETPRWPPARRASLRARSEEHTPELQSLMRISYAVFCLKKKHKKKSATPNVKDIRTQYQGRPSHQHNTTT